MDAHSPPNRSNAPLALCYGTRPQIIKASGLIEALGATWPLLTVDTGQHYDRELTELLYEELAMPAPDVRLGVGSGTRSAQTRAIAAGVSEVFRERRPWAAAVIGDTNSTLGSALAAGSLGIPVIHVEAGLRAAAGHLVEEWNRRRVDAMSRLLCAPSAAAVANLRSEGVTGTIALTGDVARDVLVRHAARANTASDLPDWPLEPGEPFALATLHRAELTDDAGSVADVFRAFGALDLPVLLPLHPRLRGLLESQQEIRPAPQVHLLPPEGYLRMLALIRDADIVVTDSGGIQREAYWLGTPCITLRSETEWTETVDCGANVLLPPERAEGELAGLVRARRGGRLARASWQRDAYGTGHAAREIQSAIAALNGALGPLDPPGDLIGDSQ